MSGRTEVLVLGAGMVGTGTALQLARRGHRVTLVDRRGPGEETSHGNAGLIQCEAAVPYAFPRDLATLWAAATGRSTAIAWHAAALPGLAGPLARYWWHSAPARHARQAQAYAALIRHAVPEHEALMAEAGAQALVGHGGYHTAFRTARALDEAAAQARVTAERFGVRHTVLDGEALARAEPGLHARLAGALHWPDPRPCTDPGALTAAYARHLLTLGGRLLRGDAATLARAGTGWRVRTAEGPVEARHAVLALGPWTGPALRRFGLRLPLFVKRGYHRHFRGGPGLTRPLLDAERGYVLAPMAQGIRLTTGAEFARLDSPPTPTQLPRVTAAARELLALPEPVEAEPWLGNRPCTPDMLPLIGRAPGHAGLWVHAGHAHQGFTLGPASGRLLAELIEGATPFTDPAPYDPARF
jgi:D-amino-acid dehydrogenase